MAEKNNQGTTGDLPDELEMLDDLDDLDDLETLEVPEEPEVLRFTGKRRMETATHVPKTVSSEVSAAGVDLSPSIPLPNPEPAGTKPVEAAPPQGGSTEIPAVKAVKPEPAAATPSKAEPATVPAVQANPPEPEPRKPDGQTPDVTLRPPGKSPRPLPAVRKVETETESESKSPRPAAAAVSLPEPAVKRDGPRLSESSARGDATNRRHDRGSLDSLSRRLDRITYAGVAAFLLLAAGGVFLWMRAASFPDARESETSASTATSGPETPADVPDAPPAAAVGAAAPAGSAAEVAETRAALVEMRAELKLIKARNRLSSLGDQAISAGSRYAFRELERFHKNPEILDLKDSANAEIMRVESHYVSTRRFRTYGLDVPRLFPGKKGESELSSRELVELLLGESNHWETRARAAQLLSTVKDDPQVAEALVRALGADPDLYVLQEALVSFAKVTGYRAPGVFDATVASAWWEQNKARFTARNTSGGN